MFDNISTEKPQTLDITSFPYKNGEDLHEKIIDGVEATQSVIIRALPNKIKMTINQYRVLSKQPQMIGQEFEGQEYFMYRTPLNIMEIEVIE